MKASIREKIIAVTMELMKESMGDINQITTRTISERANVGVGLINYHFQTKDNLINICVQRFISKSIEDFRPNIDPHAKTSEKLKQSISGVNKFLIDNESVSKISIIQDHINPEMDDNTMRSVRGINNSLMNYSADANEKNILVFALVSFIQNLFLRKELCKDLFGFDYDNDDERNRVLTLIIERLFLENNNKNN